MIPFNKPYITGKEVHYINDAVRQQLAFHKDVDFSEPVDFMVKEIPENEIKEFLIGKAISFL